MKRPRKVRSAKISEAVFLGKKGSYTFDVYPLAAEVPESPAVFIFSRRKVTRGGHVSHAASCIGETDSLLVELKKHKRAKCVRANESNVVCVLQDENGRNRLSVLSDIAEARTFGCVRNVYEPNIMRRPDVLHIAAAKFADPKPARTRKVEEPNPDEAQVKRSLRKRAIAAEDADSKTEAGSNKNRKITAKPQRAQKIKAKAKPARKGTRLADPKTAETKVSTPKTTKRKASKPARDTVAPVADAAVKRTGTKKRSASAKLAKPAAKPAKTAARQAKPTAKATAKPAPKPAKRSAARVRTSGGPAAAPKRTTKTAKPRTRISGGVDRDGGKHRLPEQKRPARSGAKARAAGRLGTRKKAAA